MICVSELSFNSGDEILVVGFKNGTGRWRPVSVHYDVIMMSSCNEPIEVSFLFLPPSGSVCTGAL